MSRLQTRADPKRVSDFFRGDPADTVGAATVEVREGSHSTAGP
jgi:hypothetical protein